MKLQGRRRNFHIEVCKFLLRNFKEIVLPKFQTQSMIKKSTDGKKRKISSRTAKAMEILAHYKFRLRLVNMAKTSYPGTTVFLVEEPYTSKMCSHCGWVDYHLGGASIFVCPNPACRSIMDRDINATSNIANLFEMVKDHAERNGRLASFKSGGEQSYAEYKLYWQDLYDNYSTHFFFHESKGRTLLSFLPPAESAGPASDSASVPHVDRGGQGGGADGGDGPRVSPSGAGLVQPSHQRKRRHSQSASDAAKEPAQCSGSGSDRTRGGAHHHAKRPPDTTP